MCSFQQLLIDTLDLDIDTDRKAFKLVWLAEVDLGGYFGRFGLGLVCG